MYSIVVEVVYCAGNNASLLRLLLMNTATYTALHCADLSHYTALFENFAVVVVDKVVASFRFGRCCVCVCLYTRYGLIRNGDEKLHFYLSTTMYLNAVP